MSATTPIRPNAKIDPETVKIIRERLASADEEPERDAREAIEELRRELKQPVPR